MDIALRLVYSGTVTNREFTTEDPAYQVLVLLLLSPLSTFILTLFLVDRSPSPDVREQNTALDG